MVGVLDLRLKGHRFDFRGIPISCDDTWHIVQMRMPLFACKTCWYEYVYSCPYLRYTTLTD